MASGSNCETFYLLHEPKTHSFISRKGLRKALKVGDRFRGAVVTRMWISYPQGLLAFLQKQKNAKRLCPECNPRAMEWEAKWNGPSALDHFASRAKKITSVLW